MQENYSIERAQSRIAFSGNCRRLPRVGGVQDGFPSPEDEALCDVLSIEGYLIARSESFFLLKVSGDSMNGIVTAVIRKYKR